VIHTTNLIVGSVSGMGSMGLVLALVGLYGLVSYVTNRRTREIGIRMAVGADPASVLAMVLRHGLVLVAWGIAVGAVASTATGRLLRAAFPSTAGIDLGTYLLVVPMLVAITLLAICVPARRAARVEPVAALRAELE
jgi:ABC-type antimicrobial peptide transport system permease subunit